MPRSARPSRVVPSATRRDASGPAPLSPLLLDPWAWVALSVVALLVVRAWGAPFGEPVADDFDHLHHALFAREDAWWGGGGSGSFWRPLAYQGYYGLLSGVILRQPGWISLLHVLLVAGVVLLVHDVARRHLPRPVAATAAVFPWLVESARALVIVPVHFVDLGLIVFSVVAWRAAEGGRLAISLAALLAALLCKETAVATAAVLPWLARPVAGGSRRPWFLGAAAVTALWAVVYAGVRTHLAMALPHGLEAGLAPRLLLEGERYAWALAGTWRALLSQPMRPGAHEGLALVASLLVLGTAGVVFATRREARARLSANAGLVGAGLAWAALATGTLLTVYPVWSPERVVYASLGLGVALAALLAAAHPLLPWALVALRLVLFALAPAAPARVTMSPPDNGAFVDFERLARLQRLMVEARTTLRREFPTLPPGAGVAMLHPPFMADYAGGDRALQVWYRDSTLRWLRWERMAESGAAALHGALEFQERATPPFRRIEPEALRLLFVAGALERTDRYQAAVDTLARADALQRDREARHLLGRVYGMRAWCLGALGRLPEAESLARQSLAIAPENADGHLTLSALHNGRREWVPSLAHLDTLDAWYPGYPAAVMMRRGILERMRAEGVVGTSAPPAR